MLTKARETVGTVERERERERERDSIVTKNEATKVAVFGVQEIYMKNIEVSYV